MTALVELKDVHKHYKRGKKIHKALDMITLEIKNGETLGLVGESGSGKSTLGKLLIGLEPPTSGIVTYNGSSLWKKQTFQRARPGEVQAVFQDPQSSLDPRMKIKDSIMEPLFALDPVIRKKKSTLDYLIPLMKRVGLKEEHLDRYPHEFSGGQRQRIAIARALITDPSFLVLDEPTSALDVSVQAQVLNLLKELKEEKDLTYLFVSHNMSVIKYMCTRVAVMYKGKIVEVGETEKLFSAPEHPYTKVLLSTLPSLHKDSQLAYQ